MGGTEPGPPRISGRDDAHNADQGISQYFLKVLIAQHSIPHWNCIEIPIHNTFSKFWMYWNTSNTQYFLHFKNWPVLGNFGPKSYISCKNWRNWVEIMIVQKSIHFSDFVDVKNCFLGENYENFAWNDLKIVEKSIGYWISKLKVLILFPILLHKMYWISNTNTFSEYWIPNTY